ncbi:MAG: hypothetical protein OIN66_04555 [Candidatus Methanoperedens sp.]|nr:hypothetical protein [Candidatus Methanoperedens sp.]
MFSWDEVPGNDSERLIKFLKQEFGISWVETAKIEKIDNGRNIRVTTEKNYLSLGLNNEKTKINLKIDDGISAEFIVKNENGKLNIYENKKDEDLKELILPTELGNVFKSMMTYPKMKYGMSGVFFWSRIQFVVSSENKTTLDKMRAFVDMFVELTWIFVFAAIAYSIVFAYNGEYLYSFVLLVIFILFSLGCYNMAVQSALDFGSYVRSIFDLYRGDLYEKIKHGQFNELKSLPEKEKWKNIFNCLWFYNTVQCPKCSRFYERGAEHKCE